MKMANVLSVFLVLGAGSVASAATQSESDAGGQADVDSRRSAVVEGVSPTQSDEDRVPSSGSSRNEAAPDPSREMLHDFQTVIDSVRSKTPRPKDPLAHLDSEAEVTILPISRLEGGDAYHAQSLEEALEENQEIIVQLRDQIRMNIHVVRALESEGFTADDVLTWETAGTDDVTVVVDDR